LFNRTLRRVPVRLALPVPALGIGVAAALLSLPAGAGAALVTPASLTNCDGSLTRDATGSSQGEPNLLDYSLSCNTDITAYTIFVVRQQDAGNNIDDFSTNATVDYPTPYAIDPSAAGTPSSELANCQGVIPSDGVNCFASAIGSDGKTTVLGTITAGYDVKGSVALDEPYCKYLPKHAKAGTPAVPTAVVGLIVTDSTGAEDGPFYIHPAKACAKIPNAVPAPKKKGKPKKKKLPRRPGQLARGVLEAAS